MKSVKRTSLYLTQAQIARLAGISGQTGLSQAELVRRAIDMFLFSYGDGDGAKVEFGGEALRAAGGSGGNGSAD